MSAGTEQAEPWFCGAFGPLYRCTLPAGHDGDHAAELDGEPLGAWDTNRTEAP